MNTNIHTLLKALRTPTLSTKDKADIRATLVTLTEQQGAPSKTRNYRSNSIALGWSFRTVFASLLLVLVGSGGTLALSEQTLPGDLLYSVKTGIQEPLLRLRGDESFETTLLEKRIVEAEALYAKGKLMGDTKRAVRMAILNQQERVPSVIAIATAVPAKSSAPSTERSMMTLSMSADAVSDSYALSPVEQIYEQHREVLEALEILPLAN